jgi:hypothetical protein
LIKVRCLTCGQKHPKGAGHTCDPDWVVRLLRQLELQQERRRAYMCAYMRRRRAKLLETADD